MSTGHVMDQAYSTALRACMVLIIVQMILNENYLEVS